MSSITEQVHTRLRRLLHPIGYLELDTNARRFLVVMRIVADGAAGDLWERALAYFPFAVTVIDAGIIPDAGFGQATNFAIISLRNKGLDGTGTTVLATRSFSAAVAAYDYTSLGTVSNPSVSAGQVLAFQKTIGGTGQIVPASTLYVLVERAA